MPLYQTYRAVPMEFPEWLDVGYRAGWVAEGCCWAHDGIPLTPEEEAEMEKGGDPCIEVLRVWPLT